MIAEFFLTVFMAAIVQGSAAGRSVARATNIKANCVVQVTNKMRTGETRRSLSYFKVKSQSECAHMQRLLGENFAPGAVASVKAEMNWRGQSK